MILYKIRCTSDTPAVGLLTTLAGSAASRDVQIAGSASRSPSSVGAGGVAFDPVGAGSTTVVAVAGNFDATVDFDDEIVTVNP